MKHLTELLTATVCAGTMTGLMAGLFGAAALTGCEIPELPDGTTQAQGEGIERGDPQLEGAAEGPQGEGPQGEGPQGEGPQGEGPQGEGPQGGGPAACESQADCDAVCADLPLGCTCAETPRGDTACLPGCESDDDCPKSGPRGEPIVCEAQVCVPAEGPVEAPEGMMPD